MSVDTDALVAAVIRGVLEQLGTTSKHEVCVLAPRKESLTHDILARLGEGYSLCFQGEEPASAPVLYILPELSCQDMADLATGRASSLALRDVLELLLQGKDVRTLGFAYRQYAATAPHALLQLYERYEAALASYGLKELVPPTEDVQRVRSQLITAEHIAQAVAQKAITVRVPANAVITPLAAQHAMEQHIEIVKTL